MTTKIDASRVNALGRLVETAISNEFGEGCAYVLLVAEPEAQKTGDELAILSNHGAESLEKIIRLANDCMELKRLKIMTGASEDESTH